MSSLKPGTLVSIIFWPGTSMEHHYEEQATVIGPCHKAPSTDTIVKFDDGELVSYDNLWLSPVISKQLDNTLPKAQPLTKDLSTDKVADETSKGV